MVNKVVMRVKSGSLRCLDNPVENLNCKKYIFYVRIDDVAEGIPMATNPREQNLKTNVACDIKQALESNDGYFHLKNRGIVLSAERVDYDNRTEQVRICFSDDTVHGNVDGGHTYKIVCEHIGEHLEQYVQFEVFTGVESIIEQLAEARNNSIQVDEKSLAELANHFEPIKEAIEGLPFYRRIAFKQNQTAIDESTGKKFKMIDAREIVSIIRMFKIDEYTQDNPPIQAYSGKAKMLEYYLKEPESYRKFVNVACDIFDLYDAIELEFADAYNDNGGRYGRKKFAGYKDGQIVGQTKFYANDMKYKVPDGIVYPTLAAFRCMLEFNEKTGKYKWKNDIEPVLIWDKCKMELSTKIMNFASAIGDNPNVVGKDSNIWDLAYMTVQRFI